MDQSSMKPFAAIGHRPSAIGHWPSAIGHWPSAIGHWSLAIGHWSFLTDMPTSKVQLVVDNFGDDASAVSQLIGLEPTAVGVVAASAPWEFQPGTSWIFEIAMPETESLEGQALAL